MTDLRETIGSAALVFRGYNITNLGRSRELLAHRAYGSIVERWLREASDACRVELGGPCDLVIRVSEGREARLDEYQEAVALIVAMELAHVELLREFFGVDCRQARLAYGYSLGEIAALIVGEMVPMEPALRIPLAMSPDCAELARDVTLGILFTRGPLLDVEAVQRLCRHLNLAGQGVIGVSTFLSPNSLLLMGQQDTIERFAVQMHDALSGRVYLRKNDYHWPPLHTPLVWQRNIPNRSAVRLHTLPILREEPAMPIFSLVTGKANYREATAREIMANWVDHPQRLWDAVYETLAQDVKTILHLGPEPNLTPATFKRLADNVEGQLADRSLGGFGLRAVSQAMRRPWLAKLLPSKSALLRAPFVEQVVAEDWLLAQPVP